MSIAYDPPVFRGFLGECIRAKSLSGQHKFWAMHHGLFILSLEKSVIKLYALADAKYHRNVYLEFNPKYEVIGGGYIKVDDSMTEIKTWGSSDGFGGLPNNLLIHYFQAFNYKITSEMGDVMVRDKGIRAWLLENGFAN